MKSGNSSQTHAPYAAPPANFRDQATGIGHTLAASRATGAVRKAAVVASMPARQRAAVPACEGYFGNPSD